MNPRCGRSPDGENFFLGMQDTALYTRDVSNMRLAMRRDDVATIVEPLAQGLAEKLVAEKSGRIDVPPISPCRCRPRSSPIISA